MQRSPGCHPEGMTDPSVHGGATELGRFHRARRVQVTPGQVGLPAAQGRRRTTGLRREELATLAGISNDYYIRLERGKETRPSPAVIYALARALQMEPDEHEHLRSLAVLAARRAPEPPATPSRAVSRGVRILLGSLRPNPAHVVARNGDLLAWNPGGLRLFAGLVDWPISQRNVWRYTFLHPQLEPCSMTGKARSGSASPTSEPSQASSRTHPIWPRSSANWSSRARNLPASGVATTYMAIPEEIRASTIPKSVTLPWAFKAWPSTGHLVRP
jgi:transcriptional regulator with XRE-family HTH domain